MTRGCRSWPAQARVAALVIVALGHSLAAAEITRPSGGASTRSAGEPARELTFVTYNVLADPVALDTRLPAIFSILENADADVIALQEVTMAFARRLAAQPWAKRYQRAPDRNDANPPGGLMILTRHPIRAAVYRDAPSQQRRGVLAVGLDIHGRKVGVAAVHLESFLKSNDLRVAQMKVAFALLERSDDAVLLGDFNFGDDAQPETRHIEPGYIDGFRSLHPTAAGFTWNVEVSPMAKAGSFDGEGSRRLDRVLVRSEVWKPSHATILGDWPINRGNPTLFPSDHFGLKLKLGWHQGAPSMEK